MRVPVEPAPNSSNEIMEWRNRKREKKKCFNPRYSKEPQVDKLIDGLFKCLKKSEAKWRNSVFKFTQIIKFRIII